VRSGAVDLKTVTRQKEVETKKMSNDFEKRLVDTTGQRHKALEKDLRVTTTGKRNLAQEKSWNVWSPSAERRGIQNRCSRKEVQDYFNIHSLRGTSPTGRGWLRHRGKVNDEWVNAWRGRKESCRAGVGRYGKIFDQSKSTG